MAKTTLKKNNRIRELILPYTTDYYKTTQSSDRETESPQQVNTCYAWTVEF